VDLEQLQLENASHCAELDRRSGELIALRRSLAEAKRKRSKIKELMGAEEQRRATLEKCLGEAAREVKDISETLPKVQAKIDGQVAAQQKLRDLAQNYEAPSTDDYIRLKLEELRLADERKLRDRKEYLERLTSAVKRQKRAKSATTASTRSEETRVAETPRGRLVRGKTFNIEFKTVER
jgi:chromosome segregation ATPase